MIKAKVSRENLECEAHGNGITLLTDLATLVIHVVDEVCEHAKLDGEATLDTFFRAVKESYERKDKTKLTDLAESDNVIKSVEPLQVHHGTPSFSTREAAWEYLEQCRKEMEDER